MISDKARPYYAAMVDEMLKFYQEEGHAMRQNELFVAVSRRFGPQMLTEVCPHLDLSHGECTVGAIEIMREAFARTVNGAVDVAKQNDVR